MVEINTWSFCKSHICGPSKIPALIFSYESRGNFVQKYLKHSPILSKSFTNFLINPNLIAILFLYLPMEHSLCSSLQVQMPLYLAIPFLSSDLALLCYPTGTKSFLCSHLVTQEAWIIHSSLHI